ncbi:MAG: hypothetical protein QN133_08475 [Armatimonadota bacterium]|nr:hypothetical protein [Armatimonadota bacterium]MDR7432577.1 hypothetical protein [Armatimonadota bacterium]MDR7541288.1 hypothetical protein [Armatimonadota bacterium]MDR7617423.1 hypothetical protein [Armatimonadota bacterium]
MRASWVRGGVLLAAVIVLGAASAASADAVLRYRGSDGSRLALSFAPGRMRVDANFSDRSASLLYDQGKRTLWIVDHDRRSYLEIRERQIRQFREARRQLEARLQQLPPAARAQVEAMLTAPGFTRIPSVPAQPCESPKIVGIELVRGLRARVVDGCKTLVRQEWATCRFWVVHGEELRLTLSDFQVLEGFLAFYWELLGVLGAPQLIEDSSLLLQPRARILRDPVFTFPVVVKFAVVQDGRELTTVVLDTVSSEPLPGERFAVPAGYAKVELPTPGR